MRLRISLQSEPEATALNIIHQASCVVQRSQLKALGFRLPNVRSVRLKVEIAHAHSHTTIYYWHYMSQMSSGFVALSLFVLSVDFAFTARRNARIASAVLATAIPSVCPSVRPSACLSHAGIVSKRLHVAQCSLHCKIAKCI